MRFRLLLLSLLLAGGAWSQNTKVPSVDGRPLFIPGEVLVRLKENTADLDKARVLVSKTQSWAWEEKTRIYHVKLADGEDVLKRVELLKNDPAVELVQPNFCYYALACTPPSVYYYSSPYDWPLTIIQAPQAWNLLGGNCPPGTGVTVAVLDTGVRTGHPDLSMINYSKSVTNCLSAGSTNINDQYGHGTFVARDPRWPMERDRDGRSGPRNHPHADQGAGPMWKRQLGRDRGGVLFCGGKRCQGIEFFPKGGGLLSTPWNRKPLRRPSRPDAWWWRPQETNPTFRNPSLP